MTCFVYILLCNNGMFYTGISWNPRKRLIQHNSGLKTPLKKAHLPVKLVFIEKFDSRNEAALREKEIKGWSRKKKLNLLNDKIINILH